MDWLDRLKNMKQQSGLTTREIASQSGLPEPTLEKLFAGQTKDPKLNTIKTVVHFLGFTLDDLAPENENSPASAKAETGELNEQEQTLIHNYRALNDEGQEKLFDYSEDLVSSGRYTKNNKPEISQEA
ncbi:helix-turn-helix domain-containing protein [Faecalispora jeddahensis]|uniref:helix-turn-helix domain-containing protein n=1 Tax=Faecalispora jeddahensis TaxID=1414721 RepID=UPI0028A94994|nr:helix-turn-helix transcriptional regulator [Faecalispora jeddahensis]